MLAPSAYERRRLENIRKNQQVLESLDLPVITQQSLNGKETILASRKRKKSDQADKPREMLLRRTSARLLEKSTRPAPPPKMGIADELAHYRGTALAMTKSTERTRLPRVLGPIMFDPEDGDSSAFLHLMQTATTPADPLGTTSLSTGPCQYRIDGEYSVTKVVLDRIYSMAVHPSRDKIIVSAGSKFGNLGIWDATDAWEGTAHARKYFHFKPHVGSITNQRYHPHNPNQLYMSSYDGTIRCLDMTVGKFSLAYAVEEGKEQLITGLDHNALGNVWYFTDTAGQLSILDIRIPSEKLNTFQLHKKKAGGLSVSPVDNNYIATSSLDDTVCLWDLRKLEPTQSDPLTRLEYGRAITSVFFHPYICDALVSTGYDDSVRIHQNVLRDTPVEFRVTHNNQTGRWITPFRAIWDPKSRDVECSRLVVGNMNRGIDVIDMQSGVLANSTSELLTAQPAANAIHLSLDLVVSGTAGGKCVLWKPCS